jgi:hypothetical protein
MDRRPDIENNFFDALLFFLLGLLLFAIFRMYEIL